MCCKQATGKVDFLDVPSGGTPNIDFEIIESQNIDGNIIEF